MSIAKTLEELLKSKGIDATVIASDDAEDEKEVTVTKVTIYAYNDVRVSVETDTDGHVMNVEVGGAHGATPAVFVGAEAQAFVTVMKHAMAKVCLQ